MPDGPGRSASARSPGHNAAPAVLDLIACGRLQEASDRRALPEPVPRFQRFAGDALAATAPAIAPPRTILIPARRKVSQSASKPLNGDIDVHSGPFGAGHPTPSSIRAVTMARLFRKPGCPKRGSLTVHPHRASSPCIDLCSHCGNPACRNSLATRRASPKVALAAAPRGGCASFYQLHGCRDNEADGVHARQSGPFETVAGRCRQGPAGRSAAFSRPAFLPAAQDPGVLCLKHDPSRRQAGGDAQRRITADRQPLGHQDAD